MDYEKLIEQLKQKDGLWCSVPTGEKLVTDAADALTALLAENEKLRDEAEGMRSNWYKAVEAVKNLRAEQEKAKTEITRLKHYEDKCHDCPIVCAKTEIIKAYEELEAAQNERDMWKEGMEDCQQSILELDAELEQVKRALAMMWFAYVNSDKETPHNYETEALKEAEHVLGPWAECMPKYLRRGPKEG